jgi:hypothetical protein
LHSPSIGAVKRNSTTLKKKENKNTEGKRIPHSNSRSVLCDSYSPNVSERCQKKLRIIAF